MTLHLQASCQGAACGVRSPRTARSPAHLSPEAEKEALRQEKLQREESERAARALRERRVALREAGERAREISAEALLGVREAWQCSKCNDWTLPNRVPSTFVSGTAVPSTVQVSDTGASLASSHWSPRRHLCS